MRATHILLALVIGLTAQFGLGGCSEQQLGRAESYAGTTHAALDLADQHVDALEQQLALAKKALAESGDTRIAAVVEQLQGAVTVAKASLPALRQAATQADEALAQLKAQAAEGVVPWWKVALTIAVPLLLPLAKTIPVVGPVVGQLGELAWAAYATHEQKATQRDTEARAEALAQTVAGIEAAKKKLPSTSIDVLHSELAQAQDLTVKQTVAVVKTAAAA